MKKNIIWISLLFFTLFISDKKSYASYDAWQFLHTEIVSVNAPEVYGNQYAKYIVKVTLLVTKLGRGGGHNRNHCANFLNQKKEANLLVKNLDDVKKLAAGVKMEVKYTYDDGLTIDRVTGQQMFISSQSWEFIRFI